ncbi:InlB B-repeat-containing protein [Caproiciproducens sp. NJN-50]|uniref:InlB B-repeat-containing protein n=2 Tax=Acutalibacteraceae TaxID=3082771 RepID=UPI0013E8EDF0|nr:InlB B-repeat-containing protein [Caproiciproducens sp. NJN-50]
MMRRNAKKYIIVLFAVTMSAALFFMTALAQAEVAAESGPVSSGSASSPGSSSSKSPGEPESPPSSDGNGNVDVPSEGETVPVKLDYNDGSAIKIVNVKQGAHVSSLPVPTRKGYVFDYWTMKGARVSSSFEIYSEITLTAQWEASAASSRKPSSYASVDTHQREVEQAASQAEAAISDPDVLSSEDWGSLLSTGQQASSGAQDASSQTSSAAPKGGGGSWLFPAGIALIVLSACGIGTFVYLQFFSGPGPRGPGAGAGPDVSDGMEFTDISSSSTGPYPAPPQEPSGTPRGKSKDGDTDTMPVPPQARQRPERSGYDPSRSQAKPVGGEKKDFDWDKFFNDDI